MLWPVDGAGGEAPSIVLGSPGWDQWLQSEQNRSFAFESDEGSMTVRRERKRNGYYWYAYRKRNGKLRKAYVGKSEELTAARLREIARALAGIAAGFGKGGPPRLRLLGEPRFGRDGGGGSLTAAKAVALLAYLALAHGPQRREHLLDLLWPESSPDAARKNLRNTLWTIRAALGPAVVARSDRLELVADAVVDVKEFERMAAPPPGNGRPRQPAVDAPSQPGADPAAALALYEGPLLLGLALPDAPDFELWLSAERERLGQIYLAALRAVLQRLRHDGEWRAMLDLARPGLLHDPLQEPLHRAIMEAHARLGERSEALRQYETLRALLARELDVAPLPETDELRAAIAAGSLQSPVLARPFDRFPLAGAARSADEGASCRTAPGDYPVRPYIERPDERAALDEALVAASGTARVALLTGELGIGKSRLWQEWSRSVNPAATVLALRCVEATRALPLAPLLSLFRGAACHERLSAAERGGRPPWLDGLRRLVPDLGDGLPAGDGPEVVRLPPDEDRWRVFETLSRGLQALGSRPLVFVVDDAHWADSATIEFLGYLVERLRRGPLLLILAYRQEDAPAALVRLVAQWNRQGWTRSLELQRLDPYQSVALVEALGGDRTHAAAIHAESGGNPYFIGELVRVGPGVIPAALGDLVRGRLEGLPEAARQVVQAASILDPDIEWTALRRVGGRGEDETLDALETLLRASVLIEQGTLYAFAHPLVAAIVRDGMSAARQAVLHRRAAEVLEVTHAARLPSIAGRLLTHYAAAGDGLRAAIYADMAAAHALTLAAFSAAVAFTQQAVALDPTPARHLQLGQTLLRAGEPEPAEAALLAALHGFDAVGDRHGAARACLGLIERQINAGRLSQAARWGDRCLEYLHGEDDPEARVMVHFLFGATLHAAGEPRDRAEAHLRSAVHLALEHGLHAHAARGRFLLGNIKAEAGELAGAVESFRESIRLARQAGDDFQAALGYNNAAYHALLLGDLAAAREQVEAGLRLAGERALRTPLQYLLSTRGEVALAEGDWDGAERWFHDGIAEAERQGNALQIANCQANLGLAARGRDDLDGALLLLEAARDAVARLPVAPLHTRIDLWLAELYQRRGERAAADAALIRAEERLRGGDARLLQEWARRLRSEVQAERMGVG